MHHRTAIAISIIGLLASVISPVLVSIEMAKGEALRQEKSRTLDIARDAIARSDNTAKQVNNAIQAIVSSPTADPCSPERLEVMRQFDITSSYIQAIGFVENNYVICSSVGNGGNAFDIGDVDVNQKNGIRLRTAASIPFIDDMTFLVIESQGYAAIIHQDLLTDVTADIEGLSLATLSRSDRQVLRSLGDIQPEWARIQKDESETVTVIGDHIVAIVKSDTFLVDAIAALPLSNVSSRLSRLYMYMIPVGLAAGVLMALSTLILIRSRLSMPTALRSALKRKELFMQYQPIVDLSTGHWVGAEALVRWRRPDGTLISPELFIPIAESCGLIGQITDYVMESVACDVGDLFSACPDFHISINLSAQDITGNDILAKTLNLIAKTHAKPGNIIMEVTERGFADPFKANPVINKLRDAGIKMAVDDFGTGYSNLLALSNLSIDCLKIDKSFVTSIGAEAATSNVVFHIIEMAKALNLTMIAEGVETAEQSTLLREYGVQFAQGWLFCRPVPFDYIRQRIQGTAPSCHNF